MALKSFLRVDQGPCSEACGIKDVRNSIASCIGCAGAVHGGPWETETGFWCILVVGDYDMLPAQTKKPLQQTKCLVSGNDGAQIANTDGQARIAWVRQRELSRSTGAGACLGTAQLTKAKRGIGCAVPGVRGHESKCRLPTVSCFCKPNRAETPERISNSSLSSLLQVKSHPPRHTTVAAFHAQRRRLTADSVVDLHTR